MVRAPILSPPGSASRARRVRPTRGPSTDSDARMRETASAGACQSGSCDASITQRPRVEVEVDLESEAAQDVGHDGHVGDGGDLVEPQLAVAEDGRPP